MKSRTAEFVDSLTSEQVHEVMATILSEARRDARSMAVQVANLLTAELRVAGEHELASLSQQIEQGLARK